MLEALLSVFVYYNNILYWRSKLKAGVEGDLHISVQIQERLSASEALAREVSQDRDRLGELSEKTILEMDRIKVCVPMAWVNVRVFC